MPILSTCEADTLNTYLLFNPITIPSLELKIKKKTKQTTTIGS